MITSAEFKYNAPLTHSYCKHCLKCVDICPVGALDGWQDGYSPETGWPMAKENAPITYLSSAGENAADCVLKPVTVIER